MARNGEQPLNLRSVIFMLNENGEQIAPPPPREEPIGPYTFLMSLSRQERRTIIQKLKETRDYPELKNKNQVVLFK